MPGPSIKICIECGAEIPISASLCGNCNSYQDYRRFLKFSGTILALLVALIAVTSNFITTANQLLSKPHSETTIQRVYLTETGVDIVFLNSGSEGAFVEKIWASPLFDASDDIPHFVMDFNPAEGSYPTVEPGLTRLRPLSTVMFIGETERDFPSFNVTEGSFMKFPSQDLTIELRHFDGSTELLKAELDWEFIDSILGRATRICRDGQQDGPENSRIEIYQAITCTALQSDGMKGVTRFLD